MPPRPLDLETLAALASGELDPAAAATARDALRHDPAARAMVHRMERAIAAMRTDDSSEPSRDAVERTKAAVATALERGRRNVASEPTGTWWRSLTEAVARLVYDSRAQPALAVGYRGGVETRQMTFVASEGCDELELDLQIAPPASSGATGGSDPGERCRVLGQLSPTNDDAPRCGERAVVALHSETRDPVAHAETDRNGVFAFSLPPGRYDLVCGVDGAGDGPVAFTIRGIDVP